MIFQEVGLCGEFTLDGRASSGAASRTLSVTWDVSNTAGTGDDEPAVVTTAVETALVPFQGSLLATIDASVLEIGVGFTFTLTVGNFLGAVDQAVVTLTRM